MRFFRPVPRLSLAEPEHAPEVAEVLNAAWMPHREQVGAALWEELTPDAEEVGCWFRGGFEVYRATFEGRAVGSVRVAFPTGACVVDRLAVHPDHRRRGFGEYICEHAVSRARRAGAGRVWARVPYEVVEARRLYRKLGFSEVAEQQGLLRRWRMILLDRAL
ncbi:MAG: GNAT family N-acetyltransferase [Chloroflexota bacterium]